MLNIIKAYSQPHRYYHTFNHISKMLINAEQFSGILGRMDLQTLRLAIIYHDYVYNPMSKTNEQDSVNAFMADLMDNKIDYDKSLIKPSELASQVMIMILDTIKHEPTFELSKYLIDLDLWSLAFNDEYKINGELIRQEYSEYSDEEFTTGRIKWVESMLKKDRIYYTSLADNLCFEEDARNNLSQDLHNLSRGYISE